MAAAEQAHVSRELVLARAEQEDHPAVELRRDLHAWPELGWTEFRTASRAAALLAAAGWEVRGGAAVCAPEARMGVPAAEELDAAWRAAWEHGGAREWLEPMRGGLTGVVAELRGSRPGPTVALRFDMDALPILEATDPAHRPAREGFASRRPGVMHACGHDAHTAIGVGIGRVLAHVADRLAGTVRIILQPAEEGGRGAVPMIAAGMLDGVDFFLCPHVGAGAGPTGTIVPGVQGFLATTKLDARFIGREAHAGLAPEEGANALLGAAHAALGLHAIARHSAGNSRVNVGVLRAGSGRNIIPADAELKLELRGETDGVVEYLEAQARGILAGAAAMWGLEHTVEVAGGAPSAASDPALMEIVRRIAERLPRVHEVGAPQAAPASDDATAMMRHVQRQGGLASYVLIGTTLSAGHHTPRFDIDERCLLPTIQLFALAALELTGSLPRS